MKTTIFLIRHGKIDNPKKIIYGSNVDLRLSVEGKKQIRNLANKIATLGYKIEKIYTSPLLRAKETSDILARILYVKNVSIEPNFRDDDMPGLAGKPLILLSQFSPTGMGQYSKEYIKLGNESQESVFKRVKSAFSKIFKKEEGRSIAIVSHGNPLSFLLFYFLNPYRKLPSVKVLLKKDFLKKGTSMRLVLDNGKVLEKELIA